MLLIFFVIIRVINPFHKHFVVVDLGGECFFKQGFQCITICRAQFHGVHVFLFADGTPVNTFSEAFFQYQIQPDSGVSPLPSINGCAAFISTYLPTISSKVVSGIASICCKVLPRKCETAN